MKIAIVGSREYENIRKEILARPLPGASRF